MTLDNSLLIPSIADSSSSFAFANSVFKLTTDGGSIRVNPLCVPKTSAFLGALSGETAKHMRPRNETALPGILDNNSFNCVSLPDRCARALRNSGLALSLNDPVSSTFDLMISATSENVSICTAIFLSGIIALGTSISPVSSSSWETFSMESFNRRAFSKKFATAINSSPPNGAPCDALCTLLLVSIVSIPPKSNETPATDSMYIADSVSSRSNSDISCEYTSEIKLSPSLDDNRAFPKAVEVNSLTNDKSSNHPTRSKESYSKSSSIVSISSRVGPQPLSLLALSTVTAFTTVSSDDDDNDDDSFDKRVLIFVFPLLLLLSLCAAVIDDVVAFVVI